MAMSTNKLILCFYNQCKHNLILIYCHNNNNQLTTNNLTNTFRIKKMLSIWMLNKIIKNGRIWKIVIKYCLKQIITSVLAAINEQINAKSKIALRMASKSYNILITLMKLMSIKIRHRKSKVRNSHMIELII